MSEQRTISCSKNEDFDRGFCYVKNSIYFSSDVALLPVSGWSFFIIFLDRLMKFHENRHLVVSEMMTPCNG